MSRKIVTAMSISLIFVVLISGCIRPASKSPFSTPSTGEKINTPLPVDQQILNATATAQAIMDKFNQPTPTGQAMQTTETGETGSTPIVPVITAQPEPSSTPSSLPPTPILTKPDSYTVHKGEYIYCLARRFDVNPFDLMDLNGLNSNSYLSGGEVLRIPTSGSFPGERALHSHPDIYYLSAGETIYDVACYYGDVAPESIIAVNGLVEPYSLSGLNTLQIP